ncbi:MAG: hypothetical protein KJ879_01550 [Nanoarchaeota archaeon]|nr:hypothetical protein [Nanoarchaeota archaeon]
MGKIKNSLKQVDEGFEAWSRADLNVRTEALEKAVQNGSFKKFLRGALIIGTSLFIYGITNDSETTTGIGAGIDAMAGFYYSQFY